MEQFTTQTFGSVQNFIYRVFGWMSAALTLTGATSYFVATTPSILKALTTSPILLAILLIAQIVVVMSLSTLIFRMNYSTSLALFTGYAILSGITLSSIFLVYTSSSVASTFFVTAGMFAIMALYGYITESDLTGMGTFLRMSLFGIIIAMLVNLFVQNAVFDLIIAMISVVVFAGLTAYDIQKIKYISQQLTTRQEGNKIAIIGALQLYLDFINMFLALLRIMGSKRK